MRKWKVIKVGQFLDWRNDDGVIVPWMRDWKFADGEGGFFSSQSMIGHQEYVWGIPIQELIDMSNAAHPSQNYKGRVALPMDPTPVKSE